MIKDYSIVPSTVVIKNDDNDENLLFRFKDMEYNLQPQEEISLTAKTSEDLAYLNYIINKPLETRVPITIDYSNAYDKTIPGTYSKIHFNKEVRINKTTAGGGTSNYQAGTFAFTLDGVRYTYSWAHSPGSSAGAPDIDYVILVSGQYLPGMPKDRAGILYILKEDHDDYYIMELIDEAYQEFEGEITKVCENTYGVANDPINLGYLIK